MTKRTILNIYLIFFFLAGTNGQEVISGLQTNTIITREWKVLDKNKGLQAADTIALPFFDDFSQTGSFPDTRLWADNNVFINNNYSTQQISAGMATFDAIDRTGHLYEGVSSTVTEGDQLTSNPVNLALPASSNIYFSFFYQPQGIADAPEINDSLTLEFYAPSENIWYSVWVAAGATVHEFKPVIIRIDQAKFLKKGFRFRFINHISFSSDINDPAMAGNCDLWNVDYILLGKDRNSGDTIPSDVAFTLPLRSLLKTHESMPWKQFRQVFLSEMGPWISIHYRNIDDIVRNVTRNFEIFDVYKNTLSHSFTSGATNIEPSTDIDYNASLLYTFNTDNPDSALFKITAILKTDDFDRKTNDTIKFYQKFGNYFAFDDGSAEGGYGINGLGSRNAMVAYRYKSFIPDTLRAIQICFNDSYLNTNLRSFDLIIWSDNNGIPGDIIYSQEEELVIQGSAINGFYNYILNDPVEVEGVFYIGWKQRSETFLNAGFDFNTLHSGRQLYWLNGNWTVSQAQGSLMIRPVAGHSFNTTDITVLPETGIEKLNIWPNPVSDFIHFEEGVINNTENLSISVIDMQGRRLLSENYEEKIDVSSLKEGVYILIVYGNNRPLKISRFIKTN